MVRTQIQLTESQSERLRRLAAQEGVSMATLIRRGVDRLLASREPVDRAARKERALEAIGRFHTVLVSGSVVEVTQTGCRLISKANESSPKMGERGLIELYIFDQETGKSFLVHSKVTEVRRLDDR